MYLISTHLEKAITDDLLRNARQRNYWRKNTGQSFNMPDVFTPRLKNNPFSWVRIALGSFISAIIELASR